ncbi:2OG-Fe(II) oxygenase [uncultured Maricaulis sp.]|uniref:prolyl hydroxylase family protein n=1 Tax=uncultured Maricaulis sp. TaxID=174710 RepID=UPI0030D91FC8|tara:strand:- start:539 stop:1786 length:1248 start_codon:yes stop_codon:yes gene_type:complete
MTDDRQTPSDPFDRALADWHGGRLEAALSGLRAATTSGDAGCASLLLQMSADPSAPLGAKVAASEALLAAPDEPSMRRHAAFVRASGYGMAADPGAALTQRIDQARSGDAQAMVEIGLLSALTGDSTVRVRLEAAAEAGNVPAMAALLRLAIEAGRVSPLARRHAAALARSGHPLGASLVPAASALPDGPNAANGHDPTSLAWPEADALLNAVMATPQAAQTLHDQPSVSRWSGFLPTVLCDYLAAQAAPLLKPAQIFDAATGQTRPDPYRKSLTAALPDGAMDLVLWAIKLRMAALAGSTFDQGEPLAVLLYRPGEQYRPHVDYLTEDGHAASADLARRGQRVATSLARLNQDFAGGDTVFPRLDVRWSGPTGDALSFANTDAAGAGDPMSLHAGEPVNSGMKLLASLWLRERA